MKVNQPPSTGLSVLPATKDSSMDAAIRSLETSKGTVTGQAMMNAIVTGAKDPDNQAAGLEFADMQKWVGNNQARLSPEAKQVFATYEKAARNALAQGKTGITADAFKQLQTDMAKVSTPPTTSKPTKPTPKLPETKFDPQKLVKTDASASKATAELKAKPGQISGSDMTDAISKGVSDLDGQAANAEFKEFQKFTKENGTKLSPEAKEVMGIYKKYVDQAKANGQTGISEADSKKMFREMRNVGDISAKTALAELAKKSGPVSGEDMAKTIKDGISDLDGNSSTKELKEFQKWAKANPDKLTPEAKQVLETYEKYAKAAGKNGISQADSEKMLKEMEQFKTYSDDTTRAAIDTLNTKTGPISGADLTKAITQGTQDTDGQAAGLERADFAKWAAMNKDRLSPEAQQVMAIYERYANRSLAAGQTGIPQNEWKKMIDEMNNVGKDRFKAFITG